MILRLRIWLIAVLLGFASLALAASTHGLSRSFSDPDESAHYVNALFLGDWLRAGLPSPIAFARDFYAHFPKLSIGHWPPGWYALLSPIFAIARPSPFGAAIVAAFVAGLPCALVYWGLNRSGFRRPAIIAAFAALLLPLMAVGAQGFLLDIPVAMFVGLGAMAWLAVAEKPTVRRYAIFGLFTAFAPLIKGNGALIMLVPAIEIALSGRWKILADRRLWITAALTLLAVLPWYYVSFRISAGGFNYQPGLAYALESLTTNARAVIANIGWAGMVLASVGTVKGWNDVRCGPVARLATSVILATFMFQAAVPVALEGRYILPLLPWLVILLGLGATWLLRQTGLPRYIALVLVAATAVPSLSALESRPPKPDAGMPEIAETMVRNPGIWLVDGRAGGEGAVIAAAAYADDGAGKIWVARASQWLSTSDFMGRDYRLAVHDAAGTSAILDRLGVRGVVSITDRQRPAYPHSILLRAALFTPTYSVVQRAYRWGDGSLLTATRAQAIAPHPELLATGSGSRNVATMTGQPR